MAADGKTQGSTKHLRVLIYDPKFALTSITGIGIGKEKNGDDLLLNLQYIYAISLLLSISFFATFYLPEKKCAVNNLRSSSSHCPKVMNHIKSSPIQLEQSAHSGPSLMGSRSTCDCCLPVHAASDLLCASLR